MLPNSPGSPRSPIYAPFDWLAALWASLIAGSAFALLHTALDWALRGLSPWMPLRMTAAIVLGPDILSTSDMINPRIVLVAIALHIVLSIVYGALLALVLPAIDRSWAVVIGGFYGLALYYINFYGFNAFSPWFTDERDWLSIVSHLVFGAVLAYAYTTISARWPRRLAEPPTPKHPENRFIELPRELETAPIKVAHLAGVVFKSRSGGVRAKTKNQWRRGGIATPDAFWPRLSEAKHFLPLLRRHLFGTATSYPLPSGLTLDLLPIVEDGLFGYELVPDRPTHTYVALGCDTQGEPVLRNTVYVVGDSRPLRLVAVNGNLLSRSQRAAQYRYLQRDARFPDWAAAAEAAWAQLLTLFPQRPRRPVASCEDEHRCLDEALAVAHSHLAQWNPFIRFVGLPNEAQHGFVLAGGKGEIGELIFQRPDIWMLRWKAPPDVVYESWSVALPTAGAARGDLAS